MTHHTGEAAAANGLELFFELSQEMLCVLDFDGCFRRLSASWQMTFGTSREALQARPWLEWTHPDDRAKVAGVLTKLRSAAGPVAFESRFLAANGAYRWLSWNAQARPGEWRIYAAARDVTTHRRHEKEFERTQQFLQSVVENLPHMIFIKDAAELRFVLLNKAGEELLGYRREELLGKNDYDFFPRSEADHFTRKDRQVLESGATLDIPEETIHTQHGVRHLHTKKIPLRDADGRPQFMLGISEDITELKRAEAELRRGEERLQSILDNTTAVIYVKDRKGRYLLVNRQYEETFGVRRKEVKGKTDYDLFPRAMAEEFRANDRRVLESNAPQELEECAPHADGPHTYLSVKFPLRDEHGQPYALCGISTDISGRKRSEEELRRLAGDLQRSNTELEQFAYIASHDLQEPLRMIASYTQLLERRYKDRLDDDAREFIAYAVDGARRMQTLINDLLLYSRVGTRARAFEPVETATAFAHALDNLQVAVEEAGAQVTHDTLPAVNGDLTQLTQLLQNLLGNALKFRAAAPPRIHLSAERQGEEWLFRVRDNGIGIAPEDSERIFLVFQRLHSREEYSGTGIGLAVCQKIVERHGGRIWVESQVGQGATFCFTLPTQEAASQEAAAREKTDGEGVLHE
jgi:PAS domain S-box-containing protein